MERHVFAVRDRAYCYWGQDLTEQNEQFLRSFDAAYFEYIARTHLEQLDGDNAPRAAVALRAAYHHGLETLFSLLCALAQSPRCVVGWIPKCPPGDLWALVHNISAARSILTQRGLEPISWLLLSRITHSRAWLDETPSGATSERFATLWSRFASDFLDDSLRNEYNSLKHGFRVSSGGSLLRVGLEHSFGIAPPESEMQTVGSSPHGTTFYVPEPIQSLDGSTHHLRLREKHLSWRAEAMGQALQLLSCSINNVVGILRIIGGAPAAIVHFNRPEDTAFFEAPWHWPVGATISEFDLVLDESLIDHVSRSQLRAELEARSSDA